MTTKKVIKSKVDFNVPDPIQTTFENQKNPLQTNKSDKIKTSQDQKNKEVENKMLTETISKTLLFVVNNGFLKDIEQNDKMSEKEVIDSGLPDNIIRTLNYYFPEGVFNHPLIGLTISAGAFSVAVINKKARGKKIERKNKPDDKKMVQKDKQSGGKYSSINPDKSKNLSE